MRSRLKAPLLKPINQNGLCEALRTCLSRFETDLEQIPYLVPKTPYRRSGQALTTLEIHECTLKFDLSIFESI